MSVPDCRGCERGAWRRHCWGREGRGSALSGGHTCRRFGLRVTLESEPFGDPGRNLPGEHSRCLSLSPPQHSADAGLASGNDARGLWGRGRQAGPLPSVTDLRYTGCRKCVSSAPCRPSTFQRRILSLQDMVRSRSPSRMPSHVGTMSLDSTGIVPSPVEGQGSGPRGPRSQATPAVAFTRLALGPRLSPTHPSTDSRYRPRQHSARCWEQCQQTQGMLEPLECVRR